MSEKKSLHIIRSIVLLVLFCAMLFIAMAPYLSFEEGSFLGAVAGPLNDLAFRFMGFFPSGMLGPYGLLPWVILLEALFFFSLLNIKAAASFALVCLVAGAFITGSYLQGTEHFVLLYNRSASVRYLGYLLLGLFVIYVILKITFTSSRREKKMRRKAEKKARTESDEKQKAFRKAVTELTHDDAISVLDNLTVANFEAFPNECSEQAVDAVVSRNLFETAFEAASLERENRARREKEQSEARSRIEQVFSHDDLKRRLEEDVETEFEFGSDIDLEIRTPSPVEEKKAEPQVIYVQQPPQVIYVNMPQNQEPAQISQKPEPEEETEPVEAVGGLSKAQDGDYYYDAQKISYQFPSGDLLRHYPSHRTEEPDIETDEDGRTIVETFSEFRIETKLCGIMRGPTFTLYELSLARGVKVGVVHSYAENIAMNLAVQSVRILAPIPGKSLIGVEVPNRQRDTIGFDEMLPTLREKSSQMSIPMVLGKTITGERVVIDVAKLPHLLIAGTTGSGKSVCVNSLICSTLFTKSPKEVRMILVDPKMVELSVYNDIPHLLTPVITDPKRAVKALAYVTGEMERRMAIFKQVGVRNIASYNSMIVSSDMAAQKMPCILVVIDEFADLMMVAGKELEVYIKRISAVARFTGIHLVLATQRPSADVITGVIKSNMPAQIAFAVSNRVNSQIILDSPGAEKLLGMGDMLLATAASRTPQRIQGAYIDSEIDSIVSFVKTQGTPDYIDESYFEDPSDDEEELEDDMGDSGSSEDMYTRAWKIFAQKGEASASYLQRRLNIGYNRAANLVERMEEDGIVGPARGSKPRELLRYPDNNEE